ncbi:MAG: hypothetical protein JXP73_08415 [Deltaproteobacteria bacterium]|nr:hypothetical protein [Deltaproteobacteria bacterium]
MSANPNRPRSRRRAAVLALGVCLAPGPSLAAGDEVAQVRALASLLDESVGSLLPAALSLPPELGDDARKTFFLNELRYCGPGDKGAGRFRAAGRSGAGEDRQAPLLAGEDGCRASLAELAERASPTLAAGAMLVDLEATWKRWELRLFAVRGVVALKAGRARPMSGPGKPVQILSVRTADLRIDRDAGEPIVLHARPVFLAGAVEVVVVLADKAPGKAPAPDFGTRAALLSAKDNLAAEIPVSFANQVLRRLTGNQPLVIPVNRDELELADVKLAGQGAGEKAQLTLAGSASPRALRETMHWSLLAAGKPLRASSLRASAGGEDCSGLAAVAALACGVRNGARVAAAEAFAQAFNQRYRGGWVHELCSPLDLRFNLAGQRFVLRGDLTSTSFSARGLALAGWFGGK